MLLVASMVLLGCASLFTTLPPLAPPDLAPLPDPPVDDAPGVEAYLPSEPAPWTDDDCHPIYRGVVVPEARALELYRDLEVGVWWEGAAQAERAERLRDRSLAEARVADARRREVYLVATIPVAVLVGVGVGVLMEGP